MSKRNIEENDTAQPPARLPRIFNPSIAEEVAQISSSYTENDPISGLTSLPSSSSPLNRGPHLAPLSISGETGIQSPTDLLPEQCPISSLPVGSNVNNYSIQQPTAICTPSTQFQFESEAGNLYAEPQSYSTFPLQAALYDQPISSEFSTDLSGVNEAAIDSCTFHADELSDSAPFKVPCPWYHEPWRDPGENPQCEDEPFTSVEENDQTELFFDACESIYEPSSFSDQSEQPSADPPLYEGASMTVSESAIALLSLMIGCKLSGEALSRIISFISLLLPSDNKFFTTLKGFHKHFQGIKTPLHFIYYCCICKGSLNNKDSICKECGPETKVGYYFHLSVIDQLRDLYKRPGFIDLLSYRFKRTKKNQDNLEDIYDGQLYQNILSWFSSAFDISLMWNTDGMSLYDSSGFQIWPFYFIINELPPHLRFRSENLILGGLAFGYDKPNPNLLLKPLFNEIKTLETGIQLKIPNHELPVTVKCCLLCGTCDAPAKSLFMRMTQFNGFHGCPRCLTKGVKSAESDSVFVYPFEENLEPRSQEHYEQHAKSKEYGLKGPSYLFYMLCNFFMISTTVDAMHCIYLGICRQLMTIWFSSDFIKQVFGADADKKGIQEKLSKLLCDLKVPHYLQRPPRSLKDFKYFKASELRTWLFATALPVLEGNMKDPYLSHFKKFVCGISLLNMNSVSVTNVHLAKTLLLDFVKEWQTLYGLRHMSFNVHCLLHLPDCVLLLGPLWASSCFGFESANGVLARLVHGTRYAGLQIQSNLGLLRNIPSLISSLKNIKVKSFCKQTMSGRKRLSVSEKIAPNVFAVGNFVKNLSMCPQISSVLLHPFFSQKNLAFYLRLKQNGFYYVSQSYGLGERDSSVAQYIFKNKTMYGRIEIFLKILHCHCSVLCSHTGQHFAFIKRFNCERAFGITKFNKEIDNILKCTSEDIFDIIPIKHLECVCTRMALGDSTYLSVPLNFQELE